MAKNLGKGSAKLAATASGKETFKGRTGAVVGLLCLCYHVWETPARLSVVNGGGCSVRRDAGSLLRLTIVGSPCTPVIIRYSVLISMYFSVPCLYRFSPEHSSYAVNL